MTVEPMTDADVERLRATVFAYNRGELRTLALYGSSAARLLARLDAERSRADAAEAERDAALARAMPEARLMRTVEEVEALRSGCYLLALGHNDHPGMIRVHLGRFYERTREIGGHDLVGHTLLGPLPDLPTPTAAQEATDAE